MVVAQTYQTVMRLRNGAVQPKVIAQSCIDAAARAVAADENLIGIASSVSVTALTIREQP